MNKFILNKNKPSKKKGRRCASDLGSKYTFTWNDDPPPVSLFHAVSFLWEYTLRSHFDLSQDTLGDMAEVHHIEIQYF